MDYPYINRELSWIDFNHRVLSEALREDVPLMERLKFLAIVSSNFDEFLMVRIANLINESELDDPVRCPSGARQSEILKKSLKKIAAIKEEQYSCLNQQLLPRLLENKLEVFNIDPPAELLDYYEILFQEQIYPLMTPLSSTEGEFDRDWVRQGDIYIFVEFEQEKKIREWILPLPSNIPRFFPVPDKNGIILSEAVVYRQLEKMLGNAPILKRGIFRILRDADLSVDEKRDENFMKAMEEILENRIQSRPIILEYTNCDPQVAERLQTLMGIPVDRSFKLDGPLRLSDCFSLLPHIKDPHLLYPPVSPAASPSFKQDQSPWKVLLEKDVLLHHPYESFSPVTHLLQQAAQDPHVLAIKMTLYRTSGDSPIIQALLDAAARGKQVTVLVELKARFDEKRNIKWAKKLSRAGALVVYGVASLKVHAKALLILRMEKEGIRRYLHMGTGNYNDKTAELYTDFSLMTSREEYTSEAAQFFNALTGYSDPPSMRHLAMAPFTLRKKLQSLLEREISRANQGEEARFIAKLNSLNDPDMVALLYRASQAGVKIDLNIRGICSVVPGITGVSENIRIVSVIGRYLEHARGYYFLNGGQEEVYLSSADWMPRNLDRRVELLFPIQDKKLKEQIKRVMEYTLEDKCQAFTLDSQENWSRRIPQKDENRSSQDYFLQFYRERSDRAAETERDQLKVRRTI